MQRFFPVNMLVVLFSLLIITGLQYAAHEWLVVQHIYISALPSLFTIVTAFLVLLAIWLVNRATINKYVLFSVKKA